MRTLAWIAGILLVVASGVFHAQGRTDPALDRLALDFAAAYNAHDAAKVASFYADDAVLMVPNEPMIMGRNAIETHYRDEFEGGASRLLIRPLESMVSGDRAFEAGAAVATLGPLSDNGKYVLIYKRVGGAWKIAYDIFNSDQTEPYLTPDRQARAGIGHLDP